MHQVNFIVREPLLDPKQKIIGYEFSWSHCASVADDLRKANLRALIGFVADLLIDDESGWLLGDNLLFLEVAPDLLEIDELRALSPKHTVLTLTMAELADPDTLPSIINLRELGFGIALKNADLTARDKPYFSHITHVEINFSSDDFALQAKLYGSFKQSDLCILARKIDDWRQFDACALLGLPAFVGKLHLTPRSGGQQKGLNPAQTIILQLMDMVRKNADIYQLEGVLKRDPTLSYKLLRYINSAGFGLGREVQSLRQAVQVLGYTPLYRWLSLLLATASSNGYSPVLMETAIIRGRLAELLGKKALSKEQSENIFIVGMFSLLDRLLGIPMEEVLARIQLPEMVSKALLSRDGIYGPFLALAEACELSTALVGTLAASLNISPVEVDKAHISALVWVKKLTI